MGDTKIKVGGKLFAVTANGALAEASQIIDVNQGNKNQQDINKEFKAALAKKIETVDPELLEDSVNPVQNKAVYKALVDGEQVIAAALNDLNTRLTRKKRIFIKHYSSSKTYEGMFAYVIPGETIKFGVYTSAKNNISIEAIAFNSSKKNPTITVANPVVTALGSYVFHVISMTIPTDVADGDIYLYKTMTVTS